MAHDETASTSKWAKSEQSLGGQQQLKKNPLQVKRKLPSVSADSVQEQHFRGTCAGVSPRPSSRKKRSQKPLKALDTAQRFHT